MIPDEAVEAALLPCPFCGGKANIERRGTMKWSMVVACDNCGARVESGDVYGLTSVEQWRWNRRVPHIPVGAMVKGSWTLADLREANVTRQEEWCPNQQLDLSFRGNELAGETGEACNVVKKLERERLGWAGSRATKEQLAEELADVVICADLTALAADVDLMGAVSAKFNATSEKIGLATRLPDTHRILSALAPMEGWKLVPVEPTEAMCEAGSRAWSDKPQNSPNDRWAKPMRRSYHAMLAAAPTPPTGGKP